MQEANQLREEGRLTEAALQYPALNAAYPNQPVISYGLAGVHALIGDYDKSLAKLKTALQHDSDLSVFTTSAHAGDFVNLIELPAWAELEAGLNEGLRATNKNVDLFKQLWRMYIKDQAYYWHILMAGKKFSVDSPVVMALWDLKRILSQKNQSQLTRIIDTYGWPRFSEVGQTARTAFYVIQHTSVDLPWK